MNKTPVTPQMLARSVIAVPPIARNREDRLDASGNQKIMEHLSQGGVSTVLYGGNANLYNNSVSEFGPMLEHLLKLKPQKTWLIPSIGPDYGKAADQATELRQYDLPTAMVLPLGDASTSAGVATGMRRLVDICDRPLIAYVKSTDYITHADLASLAADGVICAVKYAVVLDDPTHDPYLEALTDHVDTKMIVSGIGERPAIVHLTKFGLQGFTSGCASIAPALSAALLAACRDGRIADAEKIRATFIGLEDIRDLHSPLRVLHAAVELAGIAPTGPLLPFLGNLSDAGVIGQTERAAKALLAAEQSFASVSEEA